MLLLIMKGRKTDFMEVLENPSTFSGKCFLSGIGLFFLERFIYISCICHIYGASNDKY